MTITDDMMNGHGLAHGGYIFTLADQRLRLRLQQLQPARRRPAGVDHLHGPRPPRRPADRGRPRGLPRRARRHLRHARHQRAGRARWRSSAATRAPSREPTCRSAGAETRTGGSMNETVLTRARRARADRERLARRDRRAAARAAEVVASRTPTRTRPSTGSGSTTTACIPTTSQTLADLAKFPFTVKQDLRDTYPFGMFAVPREQLARIHGSSGTTGKPTVVGYTQKDIDTWADLIARSIRASGGRPGDIVPRRLRLRPLHRRPRRALRRRAARLHRRPDLGRHDRAAGDADPGLQARGSSW